MQQLERLLTCKEAAPYLGAKSERFARRLIAERRIRFVKTGGGVRIPESAIREFVEKGTVEPVEVRWRRGKWVA